MSKKRHGLLLIILCVMFSSHSMAGEFAPVNGHVKLQQQYAGSGENSVADFFGFSDIQATSLDFRLIGQYSTDNWSFVANYLLTGIQGSAVEFRRKVEDLFPGLNIDRDDMQWFNLSDTLSSTDNRELKHSLDRLYAAYSSDHAVFKLGRQTISWGNGLVFRPMDLFSPFAPDAVDTSYKPGTDMLYGQWLFDNGSELTGLIVPRRNASTSNLDNDFSSAAVKWHYVGQTLESDAMLAIDYTDTVAALSMTGPIFQAVWRFDLVPTFLDSGGSRTSLAANMETAWQWGAKNVSGYVEYFRNGFGLSRSGYTMVDLPNELAVRIARGQLFNTGRDYLSTGLRIGMTPLMQISPLFILNLNDQSALFFFQGNVSLLQDLTIDFGVSVGLGGKGSEFGGIETSPGSGIYNEPPGQIYARLAYFF